MEHLEQVVIYETEYGKKIIIPKYPCITRKGVIVENVWITIVNGMLTLTGNKVEQVCASNYYNGSIWDFQYPAKIIPENVVYDKTEVFYKEEWSWKTLSYVQVECVHSFTLIRTGNVTPVKYIYRNWEIEDLREIGTHPF